MATIRISFALAFLIGLGSCTVAQACKPVSTVVLVFEEGSATLGRDQVVLLVNRLDHFRRLYPNLNAFAIEGGARQTAPDAKRLAQHRAIEAARAVRTLFDGVELHISSNVYPPQWSSHEGNYAAVQAVPPMKDTPDCNPVPIPGFKY